MDNRPATAICHFFASRLARPELANVLWIGPIQAPAATIPLRRLVRLGLDEGALPRVDVLADLNALPFRDHQFQGIVLDTDHVSVTQVEHAEQLYRTLNERALIIQLGTAKAVRQNTRNFHGLFRQRRAYSPPVFAKRFRDWPHRPVSPIADFWDRTQSLPAHFPTAQVIAVFEKVTPPPPLPGLFAPVSARLTSGMPSGQLASTPVSGLAKPTKSTPNSRPVS